MPKKMFSKCTMMNILLIGGLFFLPVAVAENDLVTGSTDSITGYSDNAHWFMDGAPATGIRVTFTCSYTKVAGSTGLVTVTVSPQKNFSGLGGTLDPGTPKQFTWVLKKTGSYTNGNVFVKPLGVDASVFPLTVRCQKI